VNDEQEHQAANSEHQTASIKQRSANIKQRSASIKQQAQRASNSDPQTEPKAIDQDRAVR
jgi:hypothetical protein